MHIKFSTPAAFVLTAVFGFAAFATTGAQAGHNNWFFSNYDRYEDQAYYDNEYYDEEADEYVVYAPPRRFQRNRWQRRQDRLRRWAKRQNRKALRRANRPDRQRLYDAWRNDPHARPHRKQVKKPRINKRRKLAYVPLPRSKPYHLIPSQAPTAVPAAPAAIKKLTLDGQSKPQNFDQRPTWNASPVQKPVVGKKPASKKDVEVASLPKVATPAPVKAKPAKPKKVTAKTGKQEKPATFQPIRIEVVKSPQTANLRQPRKIVQRPASNQLSCDKAKSIVSGFGFSGVTAQTCTGTIYDFTAKRDGKPYSVKVSSLSGELKGVKKLK